MLPCNKHDCIRERKILEVTLFKIVKLLKKTFYKFYKMVFKFVCIRFFITRSWHRVDKNILLYKLGIYFTLHVFKFVYVRTLLTLCGSVTHKWILWNGIWVANLLIQSLPKYMIDQRRVLKGPKAFLHLQLCNQVLL